MHIRVSPYTSAIIIDGLWFNVDSIIRYSKENQEIIIRMYKEYLESLPDSKRLISYTPEQVEEEVAKLRESIEHRAQGGDWFPKRKLQFRGQEVDK